MALRGLASDCLPGRSAHAVSGARIASASVGRTAATIPRHPTSGTDDGGTATSLARCASLATTARTAATRVAVYAEPLVRLYDASAAGPLSHSSRSLFAYI